MRRAAVLVATLALTACAHVRLGLPGLFPVTTLWTATLETPIEGPLATDGSRIFVATQTGIRAFDLAGDTTWQIASTRVTGTLAAAAGVLIVHSADGVVTSLDPANGSSRWSIETGVRGALPPVIDRDRVLVAGKGLTALDLPTGRILWSVPETEAFTVPASGGAWIVLAENGEVLRCRDRATGAARWKHRVKGASIVAAPIVDDQKRVLVGTTDRRVVALGGQRGNVLWTWKVGADVQNSGAILGQRFLVPAFDAVLYGLNRGNGSMEWRAPLPSRPLSGPLLVKDSVLVACYESDVVGFNARTGQKLGALKTPDLIRTAPLLVEDRLYVGLRNKSLVAFKLDMSEAKPPAPAPASAGPPGRKRPQP